MKNVIVLMLLLFTHLAHSAEYPIDKSIDRRVKTVVYHPDQVYELTTGFGVASTIAFSEQEEVIGVSLGDPTVWQIVPIGNTLNIKPIGLSPDTNLTVWTTKRLYLFHLRALPPVIEDDQIKKAKNSQDLLYLLKFIYNDRDGLTEKVSLQGNDSFYPHCINEHYSVYGDKQISPHFICDDGQFTYLQFSPYQERPAILLVDEMGNEQAINTRQEEDYHVITRLGNQFTLRHGTLVGSIFNESPLGIK